MRWITQIEPKPDHGQQGEPVPHTHGLKGGCLHPLFGLGVATAIALLAGGAWYLVTQL